MLKKVRPTSPARRHRIDLDRSSLHKGKPEKSLLMSGHLKRQGRDSQGHISVRHRGGGVKKRLRIIDWRRDKVGVEGIVKQIEYDPNRSANIALVFYVDGEKRYILAPEGLKAGDKIINHPQAEIKAGNTLKMADIPVGLPIHNLELTPGKKAKCVRSAGTSAIIQAKDTKFATVLLPSKEIRLFDL
ncbi:50S ribosomal protein L2, partial [Microgenomates group bacterium]|nr:50S ribosomal protein L2 [Microgenomates group bacterium]